MPHSLRENWVSLGEISGNNCGQGVGTVLQDGTAPVHITLLLLISLSNTRGRFEGGHRHSDEARLWGSHGTHHSSRLCRTGYHEVYHGW